MPRYSGSGSPYSISWISGDSVLAYGLLGAGLRKIFHSAYIILVCVKVERELEYRHEYVRARVCMSDPEEETKRGDTLPDISALFAQKECLSLDKLTA